MKLSALLGDTSIAWRFDSFELTFHARTNQRSSTAQPPPHRATMAPSLCESCHATRALILRPKNRHKLCRSCFLSTFEAEIHHTITTHALFKPGERIAIGASGGKDSTVLAAVLGTLNVRHGYGLELVLLSIDEGITGYRDDSLETVKRNAMQYDMPLTIVSYKELYGWTMDEVVGQVGKKGNCTYCGVFRRQALDRGAEKLGIQHVVTGHNADDIAETVVMNCEQACWNCTVSETNGASIDSAKRRFAPSGPRHVHCDFVHCIDHQTQQTAKVCV